MLTLLHVIISIVVTLVVCYVLWNLYFVVGGIYLSFRVKRLYDKDPEAFRKAVQDGRGRLRWGGYKGKIRLIQK